MKFETEQFYRGANFYLRFGGAALIIFCAALLSAAQSTNQNFPTAITSNEVSGKISARDIGDPRLTGYFYTFDGTQGDIFINVVTANLNGDIDVFTADNLKPLTKITIYADNSENETGRVVYLRQPTKLILRIEGRTPNDDAATFSIKFAGSFVAAQSADGSREAEMPTVKAADQSGVRVNSIGTIIEVKPKPTVTAEEITAENTLKTAKPIAQPNKRTKSEIKNSESGKTDLKSKEINSSATITVEKKDENANASQPVENKTDRKSELKPTILTIEKPVETGAIKTADAEEKNNPVIEQSGAKKVNTAESKPKKVRTLKNPKPLPVAALENIRLIILFRDGTKIERPMSEVLKFGIDKGVLTVITKDGVIGRYSILEVEKTTIE